MAEPPTGVCPVPSQGAATVRSPGDRGRGVCSPSAAAAILSTSTATLPTITASTPEPAHPPAAVDTPMYDTYSGSSPMDSLISLVRPVCLLRSLESQDNETENGVQEDTDVEIKNSRKRSKPGSSTRVGSEETRNVYEKAFMMASQRESGHIFEPVVGTIFDSEVDAIQYYNTYSWEVGFGIRKGKKYVNSEKYKTMRTLLCSCEVVKSLRVGVPIEIHVYKVYTHAMFLIFSDILYKSGSFMVRGPPEGGVVVLEHFDAERRSKYFKVRYEVDVDLGRREFKCECGLFEHTGMVCRHVLKAMVHYGVIQIPPRYIIKRWTRNARDVLREDIGCYQRDSETGVST